MVDSEYGDSSHLMELLLDGELYLPSAGEIRSGRVVAHRNHEILVDIGAKSEGIISGQETATLDAEARKLLAEGNEILVYVVDPEDDNGNIILSYKQAAEEQDWRRAVEMMDQQETCETKVIGFNKGGLLVNVGQLRGFVPSSQLRRDRQLNPNSDNRDDELRSMVGQTLYAKVIEVDRERNRLILSEQAASKEVRQARRAQRLAAIQEGEVFEGRVVNLADFGVFVDIGGIEGLVHVSEISWKRIHNPTELLKKGDKVSVCVLGVDNERQRIALSIKRLQTDPWTVVNDLYQVGQLVEAEITRLTKFGAFARLSDEYQLEGLIHISEMSEDRVDHPRVVVKPSDRVMVRIIRIDRDQRQLGLSLKQVASEKYFEADLAQWEQGN
jgi:small subunit ribosomal protein S1